MVTIFSVEMVSVFSIATALAGGFNLFGINFSQTFFFNLFISSYTEGSKTLL
jgi:hypothetical protein